jgi:YfiH family protein
MRVHKQGKLTILWGDKANCMERDHWQGSLPAEVVNNEPFVSFARQADFSYLVSVLQVHGTQIIKVESNDPLLSEQWFGTQADGLITSASGIGLMIRTADCLPLVLYDPVKEVVALVHAGWRGTVDQIVVKTLNLFKTDYGSSVSDIQVWFGPCALSCCYQVDQKFLDALSTVSLYDAVVKRGKNWYFDIPRYNAALLKKEGVSAAQLYYEYNQCTICNEIYCSYRRESGTESRNVTVVSLK